MVSITITGDLGSGKSSVGRELAHLFDFEYFSTGILQRKLGEKMGMNTLELNYYSEKEDSIDLSIDDHLKAINESHKLYVLDSRMAWHFVKNTFKVFLTVNSETAAMRVIADQKRKNEPIIENVKSKALNLIERRRVENRRFKIKYGVDCDDFANYDLVIDSSKSSIDTICYTIKECYYKFINNEGFAKFWFSPTMLYPTEHVRSLAFDETKVVIDSIAKDGYFSDSIIEVVKYHLHLFIWNGHKRTSGAVLQKIQLVPINILATDVEEIHKGLKVVDFIRSACNLSLIYDWEHVHKFKFDEYPEFLFTFENPKNND